MRYLTAGESHGPGLTTIIEGVPAHLPLVQSDINEELKRRQGGYGRGRRMKIEKDLVEITSGVRHGKTTGAPIALSVTNDDFVHWSKVMGIDALHPEDEKMVKNKTLSRPRPGHADLNGAIKYNHRDMRNVLERSSARETTMRVAAGSVAKKLLKELGITVGVHVLNIGGIKADANYRDVHDLIERAEASDVRCVDDAASEKMKKAIDEAKKNGDSIGGVVQVVVEGVPIGVGSHVHYDRKLDGKLGGAVMTINAFKGAEVGIGFEAANLPGSQVHDEIAWDEEKGYHRKSNRLGGFEGGMTNGMPIKINGVMKPIPTLYKPLQSVDIASKEPFSASIERSDSCAVPAAAVVCENVIAFELADAIVDMFGHDRFDRIQEAIDRHRAEAREF
ncbi:chorismate synthase [Salicibibacter kimchii]|uniref:Chorismate synthase n=1 Tax=Salicibibacter kimchii TaxID=2099786 RepID=A0A345BVA6_9BACI|nr:chorismate synthase [Salicibibacter kimchii]AXF54887.1 chorismate synthase [Salicibibacter kimchii]